MPAKKTPANLPAKATGTNLVDIKAQLAAQVAALSDRVSPGGGASIRITQDKKFKFPDNTEAAEFEGVVVDFVTTRAYYEGVFDAKNPQPPACFAISRDSKGMAPSNNSPVKQSDSCDTCQHNQFGSGTGNSKACKEGRKLAILPPDADADTPIWPLTLSPTAVRAFDGFVLSTGRTFNTPPVGVIARFSFDPSNTYASVRLDNPQPNEQLAAHFARQKEAQDILAVEPDVSKYGQEPPAPVRAAPVRRNTVRR